MSWTENMYRALTWTAQDNKTFTNDDVFDMYEKYFFCDAASMPDKRSYGAVVQRAVKDGLIEWKGQSVVTRRKNCNKMLIRVWHSKIYQGYDYNPQKSKSWWTKFKEKHFDEVK